MGLFLNIAGGQTTTNLNISQNIIPNKDRRPYDQDNENFKRWIKTITKQEWESPSRCKNIFEKYILQTTGKTGLKSFSQ